MTERFKHPDVWLVEPPGTKLTSDAPAFTCTHEWTGIDPDAEVCPSCGSYQFWTAEAFEKFVGSRTSS